ncbi:MAG: hypothetical protein ACQEST_00275 [Bacteroidota bacterium]
MTLATFLLLLISGFVAVKLIALTNKKGRLKYLGLAIATAILCVIQLIVFIDQLASDPSFAAAAEFIVEWGHITALAFVLSSLTVFIRESKPVFAQFPMLYTALPLLIVISYVLVQDTYALKNWLIAIYQGGAIVVALLMYSVYTYRRNEYGIILGGIVLFLISYLTFWYTGNLLDGYIWTWKLLVGMAMIITLVGYEQTDKELLTDTD